MRSRKTVSVKFLRDKVNHFLANSKDEEEFERIALAGFLETVLHETGNYKGFNYLGWLNGGAEKWRLCSEGMPERVNGEYLSTKPFLGDETRRVYF